MAAACPAMPAASSAISPLVTPNRRCSGMMTSPRYSSHDARPASPSPATPPIGHRQRGGVRRRGDAIQEQHHLRPLAQHRDGDDGGQRGKRALAEPDRLPHLAQFAGHAARVARHPQDVPAQHDHREAQDRRGEHSWPAPSNALDSAAANTATRLAPATPPRSRRRPSARVGRPPRSPPGRCRRSARPPSPRGKR